MMFAQLLSGVNQALALAEYENDPLLRSQIYRIGENLSFLARRVYEEEPAARRQGKQYLASPLTPPCEEKPLFTAPNPPPSPRGRQKTTTVTVDFHSVFRGQWRFCKPGSSRWICVARPALGRAACGSGDVLPGTRFKATWTNDPSRCRRHPLVSELKLVTQETVKISQDSFPPLARHPPQSPQPSVSASPVSPDPGRLSATFPSNKISKEQISTEGPREPSDEDTIPAAPIGSTHDCLHRPQAAVQLSDSFSSDATTPPPTPQSAPPAHSDSDPDATTAPPTPPPAPQPISPDEHVVGTPASPIISSSTKTKATGELSGEPRLYSDAADATNVERPDTDTTPISPSADTRRLWKDVSDAAAKLGEGVSTDFQPHMEDYMDELQLPKEQRRQLWPFEQSWRWGLEPCDNPFADGVSYDQAGEPAYCSL